MSGLMTLTVKDIRDRLRVLDEVTLLELLNLSSEEIVDRFEDVIQDRADLLEMQLEELVTEDGDFGFSDEE